MPQQITTISPLFSTPYLTTTEYKQAPTAVDVDDLVGGGSYALNDQELSNVISRASSWIDAYCGQVLASTVDTDTFRARVSRDGFLKVHPRFWPITELLSLSYGSSPNSLNSVDVTTCWIEQMDVVVPVQGISGSFLGALGFSGNFRWNSEIFCSMTYVNGYANTLLTVAATAGDSSLAVKDLTGFTAGHQFQIFDGEKTELLTVSSSFTASTGAGSLPLTSAITNAHSVGVSVSALPPAIKQAAILMTSSILKARGNSAIVMGQLSPTQIQSSSAGGDADTRMAKEILAPYRRVR